MRKVEKEMKSLFIKREGKVFQQFIVGIILTIIISINILPIKPISANDTQPTEIEQVKLNSKEMKEYIKECAFEWAKMIEPDLNLKVKNIKSIVTENKVEYSVSYFLGKIPYGYAILQWTDGDFVVLEGIIEKNQKGIYEEITELIEEEESLNEEEVGEELVKIAETQYGVVTENKDGKDIVYDNYGNEQPIVKSQEYAIDQSIFIDKAKFEAGKKYITQDSITLKKFTNRPLLFDWNETKRITEKYACAIQSLLQISYMEKLCTDTKVSIKSTYNQLWNRCNTILDDGEYGNTIEDAARGFVAFARYMGFTGTTYKGEQKNPSVAWIKDKLEYNRPIIMGYTINVNGYNRTHAISILGWRKAKKVSSGKTYNYLMVYNGWKNQTVYLNYTTVDFSAYCSASYFWVKK